MLFELRCDTKTEANPYSVEWNVDDELGLQSSPSR